ncbi:hypothetical protein [Shewanella sp. Iso12]|uniref:hypothetical protein n=1 Tax=Shewanella sp. Iso12 TaxID=1826753 RepID=UPI0014301812|nr:hypothetical protein [Shewanella sp. Iso12]NJI86929.1 hypothetical protein [Shewanella sp. Iso12]
MLEAFVDDVANVASQVNVDWYQTRHVVTLDSCKVKTGVVGLELADRGRIWVIGHTSEYLWTDQETGEQNLLRFPTIYFRNFRKHFPEPVVFKGFDVLYAKWINHRGGNRFSRLNETSQKSAREQHLKNLRAEDARLRDEATRRDLAWMNKLPPFSDSDYDGSYFEKKRIPTSVVSHLNCRVGFTSVGVTGRFIGVPVFDTNSWKFLCMQRLYDSGQKMFRKHSNFFGGCVVVPGGGRPEPAPGQPIYIMESYVDAVLAFSLTSSWSIAALNADNIVPISLALAKQFPDSPQIFVADNDQYGDSNAGVDRCEEAITKSPLQSVYLIIPQFQEKEKSLRYKDLTDYDKAYGRSETKKLLVLPLIS